MKKRLFCLLLVAVMAVSMGAVTVDDAEEDAAASRDEAIAGEVIPAEDAVEAQVEEAPESEAEEPVEGEEAAEPVAEEAPEEEQDPEVEGEQAPESEEEPVEAVEAPEAETEDAAEAEKISVEEEIPAAGNAVKAAAATGAGTIDVSVSASKTELKVGDEITLTVSVSNPGSLQGITVGLRVPSQLEYVSYTNGGVIGTAEFSGVRYDGFPMSPTNASGVLFTATYKVKEAVSGAVAFSAYVVEAYDGDLNEIATGGGGSVSMRLKCATHQFEETRKEATCTEDGSISKVCSVCGEVGETEVLAALGHSYEWKVVKEATCTEDGSRQQVCVRDKAVGKTEAIPATGHQWDAGVADDNVQCGEKSKVTYTCQVCGTTRVEENSVVEHKWGEGKRTKEPTCTETGTMSYTCERCGETREESIAALGHEYDDGVVTQEPTCTKEGVKTFTCKHDPKHTYTEPVAKIDHTYGEWVETKAATCLNEGEKTRTCTMCGEAKETEAVAALGHLFDENAEPKVIKEPTCTETGIQVSQCLRENCDLEGGSVPSVIEMLPHTWGEWEVTKKATATAKGEKQRTCSVCDTVEKQEIPATGSTGGTGTGTGGGSGAPRTGDENDAVLWLAMLALCSGLLALAARRRRGARR